MSEQEKKSGGSSAGGSSVVMVEQSAASRHKQPYRPTDLQEDASEMHHKRSKAPAVPSVTEELKNSAENPENIERRECERAVSSEKHSHIAAKKLSLNTKRRDSTPETIPMTAIDVETKKGTASPIPQPIPAQVGPESSTAIKLTEREKAETEKKGDDDSITEEIAELRTPEVAKKKSEHWDDENKNIGGDDIKVQDTIEDVAAVQSKINESVINNDVGNDTEAQDTLKNVDLIQGKSTHEKDDENKNDMMQAQPTVEFDDAVQSISKNESFNAPIDSQIFKKKEITWYDGEYLPKGLNLQELGSRSKAWMLESKMSVGPCLASGVSFGEPSGITFCVPKKSLRDIDFKPSQSGICITVSRKCLDKRTKSGIDFIRKSAGDRVKLPFKGRTGELKIEEVPCVNFLGNIKGQFDNMCGKIKNVLHI